jgi:hypothetical protein
MRKDLKIGLLAVGALVLFLVIYLIVRHEKYRRHRDNYQAAIGALRPSYPGEYEDIGGIPRGLGWV